jgi:hypothetical protein
MGAGSTPSKAGSSTNALKTATSNATAMCQAAGKQWFDYRRLTITNAFIEALAAETGIPGSKKPTIELANVVAVQRPHHADAREHRRAARRRDQDQCCHSAASSMTRSAITSRSFRRTSTNLRDRVGGCYRSPLEALALSRGPQRSTRAESPVSPEISPKEICQTVFG